MTDHAPMLKIQLFGTPTFTLDTQPLTINRRKSRLLLIYLAAHTQAVQRDSLLPLLWPTLEPQAARKNLRVILSGLRKQLGTWLIAEADTLFLADEVEVDVRQIEGTFKNDTLSVADIITFATILSHYSDDFLANVSLDDLSDLEQWRTVEQIRYRRLVNRGYLQLSQLYEANGQYRAGLDALVRGLDADPLQEDLQRRALHLHYLAGDRSGAIRRYEQFQQLLIDEMGVPPMDETHALYDAIITDRYHPDPMIMLPPTQVRTTQSTPTELPFVGRLTALDSLAHSTNTHKLVLVEGEAGIGKSRLLTEYIQQLNHTALPLIGHARELESELPYQPIVEALRTLHHIPTAVRLLSTLNLLPIWAHEVARLLPDLMPRHDTDAGVVPQSEGAHSEIRLWEGISQLLLALAAHQPIIFMIDDLHWADTSTLGLLGYCLRKIRTTLVPVTIIAATRPPANDTALTTLLDSLTREGALMRLPLQRLTQADIAEFTRHANPSSDAQWLMTQSEGNPFILTELVRYMDEHEDTLPSLPTLDLTQQTLVPPTVQALIRTRLSGLSNTAWQVLSAAAVLGREFDFEILADSVALSELNALEGLEELQAAHIVHVQPAYRYRFDHHLTLAVANQEIGEVRQRIFHRRVAEALERHYSQKRQPIEQVAGKLAYHFEAGGKQDQALVYAMQAGTQAFNVAAWQESIGFYEQAQTLAHTLRNHTTHIEILVELSRLYIRVGNYTESAQTMRTALSIFDQLTIEEQTTLKLPIGQSYLYARLVLAWVQSGRYDELRMLADEETGELPIEGYANQISRAFALGVVYAQPGTNLEKATAYFRQVAELLDTWQQEDADAASHSVFKISGAMFEMAQIYAKQGDLTNAIRLYREGVDVTRPSSDHEVADIHVIFLNNLAYHLDLQGDPSAQMYAETGLRMAREKGILSALPYLLSTNGELTLNQGQIDAAERYFREGLTLARQFELPERIAGLTANLGLVAKRRGENATALDLFNRALTHAEAIDHHYLITQICWWMASLLPESEATIQRTKAQELAQTYGFQRLLDEMLLTSA
ncbi:MAG: AAA family ATPase [Chloroflexota bacterium]